MAKTSCAFLLFLSIFVNANARRMIQMWKWLLCEYCLVYYPFTEELTNVGGGVSGEEGKVLQCERKPRFLIFEFLLFMIRL